MYIYNVTTNVHESIQIEWLKWMKEKHIPNMLETGKFISAKMSQVLIDEEMGGVTYSVQYTTDSIETLHEYYNENATELREEALTLYKDKIVIMIILLK